jgi:hypothetical protein
VNDKVALRQTRLRLRAIAGHGGIEFWITDREVGIEAFIERRMKQKRLARSGECGSFAAETLE